MRTLAAFLFGKKFEVNLRQNPPKHTRFPVNRQNHTQKHPYGYLTPILKKLLNKKIKVQDPEIQKILEIKTGTKAELKKVIMLRWILNAIQGENTAIEGILDRIDGKVLQNIKGALIDQSQHITYKEVKIVIDKNTDISSTRESRNSITGEK